MRSQGGKGRNAFGMEEVGRCPPADICGASCKEEVDEAFLLEVYVI